MSQHICAVCDEPIGDEPHIGDDDQVQVHDRCNEPSGYGMLRGLARAQEQRRLDEEYAQIEETIANCPNCKISKTFAIKKRAAERQTATDARFARLEQDVQRAACKRHRNLRHLAYVTSPLSETYWSS